MNVIANQQPLADFEYENAEEHEFDIDKSNVYRSTASERWLVGAILVQVVCQLALLMQQLGAYRVIFRMSSFGYSLVAFAVLVFVGHNRGAFPAKRLVVVVLSIVAINIVIHPITSSFLGGLATLGLYLAIAAPVFWVPNLLVTRECFKRLIWAIFLFQFLSTIFGVLQSLYPGQFQPNISTIISNYGHKGNNLKITLTNGMRVFRPMGLTDTPGGAGVAGFYTIIFGMGIWLTSKFPPAKLIGLAGVLLGAYCIYLSQIRSLIVLVAVVTVALLIILVRMGKVSLALQIAILIPVSLAAALSWATLIGGDATVQRFSTLLNGSPTEIYQKNRGGFLTHTINVLLPEYPFGAGLGRWGMMNLYFGVNTPEASPIWAEIQWTGWLLDGGVPLVFCYSLAVIISIWNTYKTACRSQDKWLSGWGLLLVAYSIGLCAQTFGSMPFLSQFGYEFWLLNSAYWTCVYQTDNKANGRIKTTNVA